MNKAEYLTSACDGKEQFHDAAMAQRVAMRMRRAGRTVNAYRCKLCRCWHVGQR